MGHPQMIQDDDNNTTSSLGCERILVSSGAVHPSTTTSTASAAAAVSTTTALEVVVAAATPTAPSNGLGNGSDAGYSGGGACRRCRGEMEDPFATEADPKIASEARAERVGAELIAALKAQRLGEEGGGGEVGQGEQANSGGVAAAARRRVSQLEAELLGARAEASKAEEMLKERGEACGEFRACATISYWKCVLSSHT